MPVLGGPASAFALALTMFVEAVGYGVVAPTLPFLARNAGAGEAPATVATVPFGAIRRTTKPNPEVRNMLPA